MMDLHFAPSEVSLSSTDLIDALNNGIIKCIQTSGNTLPSSLLPTNIQLHWTEYANVLADDGSELFSPVVEDLKRYAPLVGATVGSDGRPLLYAACLGLLLSKRDSFSNKINITRTPLSTFLSIASFLLDEMECDPNEPTETKGACHRPPLHLLARSCHSSAVKFLLSRGADPNQPDDEGWTAMMACCIATGEGGPTDEERVETVKVLTNCDLNQEGIEVDIDAQNYCGYAALHYACEGLNSALIQCLLKDGTANVTLKTVWGQSAVGIVRSQRDYDPEQAAACEAILLTHLKTMDPSDTIHSFLEEERKALDLANLIETVLIPASLSVQELSTHCEDGDDGLTAQDRRIVTALMAHLGLNPAVLFHQNLFHDYPHHDMNLYEELHGRIMELIPQALVKVYRGNPTNEEREIVTCINDDLRNTSEKSHDGARYIDSSLVMRQSFCLHRERGHVARRVELLTDLIVGPLQRTISFGVPSNVVLRQIINHSSQIFEVGAGTGYWSCLLSKFGADVVCYDANPPGDASGNSNVYFGSRSFHPVQKGIAPTIFDGSCFDMTDRALLIVWPNNPDAIDNPHVAVDASSLPPVWDLECLQKYYEIGGKTVIYVGEREDKIELMPDATAPDCGFCASRGFQQFLKANFELKAEFKCPKWWMKADDVTVWERN